MNGVHDMGGSHGMGPVVREEDEPVFHAAWEGRVHAMNAAMAAGGKRNIDAFRHAIERIAPARYLAMTYYEKWFTAVVDLIVQAGFATQGEIESGQSAAATPKTIPALTGQRAAEASLRRPHVRRDAGAPARFRPGQPVRARNIHPAGHTRLPRYARGKSGIVERDRGIYVFPDTNAHFLGEKAQHLYSVRFAARELWGDQAAAHDSVYLDMWDDYLEPA
jgi:nitrile hydratase beta subunit